jgi:hypothetical protein
MQVEGKGCGDSFYVMHDESIKMHILYGKYIAKIHGRALHHMQI